MPILKRPKIREGIKSGELIVNAEYGEDREPIVEAASYDLRAGIVLWRDRDCGELETRYFDTDQAVQPVVTLQPGQMIFVITHEELKLSPKVSGTVYSRNKLDRKSTRLNSRHR